MSTPIPAAPSCPPIRSGRRPCPHCGSSYVESHGSFARKDGARRRRQLCRGCGRTFSENTGTPLHYIKKDGEFRTMSRGMAQAHSLRWMSATLGVHLATAFRWRHRLLSDCAARPQPILTGSAAASEAYVPYSEKGSRRTHGPGAWGRRVAVRAGGESSRTRFRRFAQGKPSCVLVASGPQQHVVMVAGQGRPTPAELLSCLARALGPGAELWAAGLAPYAEACRLLGIPYRGAMATGGTEAECANRATICLHRQIYNWLRYFRGVATRYLHHYLAWFRQGRLQHHRQQFPRTDRMRRQVHPPTQESTTLRANYTGYEGDEACLT